MMLLLPSEQEKGQENKKRPGHTEELIAGDLCNVFRCRKPAAEQASKAVACNAEGACRIEMGDSEGRGAVMLDLE